MKISVVGAGVIGQATGIGFFMKGNNVVFFDVDERKLEILEEKGYKTTEKIDYAIHNSDIVFVCVPSPTVDGSMDFSFLKGASVDIADALRHVSSYRLIVVRSTVLPSTTRRKVVPILEQHSELKAGKDFGVCMNPEFLREKSALQDFLNPSRIVIGELDKRSGDMLEELYKPFPAHLYRVDLDDAEMVKYVSNMFLASKISFFNEIFIICKELGLNSDVVSKIVALDPRIGEYGVYGGRPFEGSCLPKDLEAFISYVKSKKINPKLLEEVFRINQKISSYHSNNKATKET
jgi:UDPglucose 6-dehydrogenase